MASAIEQDTKALEVAFNDNLPFHLDAFRDERRREPIGRELRQIRRDCLGAVHDAMVYTGAAKYHPNVVFKIVKAKVLA